MARASGFENAGLDLIYGFDGHDERAWLHTLERAVTFGPEHLSCYQMTLEAGTPFGKMHAEGTMGTLDDEKQADLFLMSSEFLEDQGYLHYEVSNFFRGARTQIETQLEILVSCSVPGDRPFRPFVLSRPQVVERTFGGGVLSASRQWRGPDRGG